MCVYYIYLHKRVNIWINILCILQIDNVVTVGKIKLLFNKTDTIDILPL